MPRGEAKGATNGGTLGFEEKLWAAADKLRSSMDPSEYKHVALPPSVLPLLRTIVHDLREGAAVSIVPTARELTTQQAANLLNVSRPYLIRLLERGDIPYSRVGAHRRLRLPDVLSYREDRARRRRQALDELARLSQGYGLYDE